MKRYKVTIYSGSHEYVHYLIGTLKIKEYPAHYEIITEKETYYFPIERSLVREAHSVDNDYQFN